MAWVFDIADLDRSRRAIVAIAKVTEARRDVHLFVQGIVNGSGDDLRTVKSEAEWCRGVATFFIA